MRRHVTLSRLCSLPRDGNRHRMGVNHTEPHRRTATPAVSAGSLLQRSVGFRLGVAGLLVAAIWLLTLLARMPAA